MSVKVLLFGKLSESLSGSELHVEFAGPISVEELFLKLMKSDTKAKSQWKDYILYAVNQIQVQRHFQVKDGDEVAFMPPLSGG